MTVLRLWVVVYRRRVLAGNEESQVKIWHLDFSPASCTGTMWNTSDRCPSSSRAARSQAGRQVSPFLRCSRLKTRPPSPSSSPSPSIMPPPCRWFQEAEAGILVCFQKSLDKFDSWTVERHKVRRNMTVSVRTARHTAEGSAPRSAGGARTAAVSSFVSFSSVLRLLSVPSSVSNKARTERDKQSCLMSTRMGIFLQTRGGFLKNGDQFLLAIKRSDWRMCKVTGSGSHLQLIQYELVCWQNFCFFLACWQTSCRTWRKQCELTHYVFSTFRCQQHMKWLK